MDKTISKLKTLKYLITILLLSMCACSKYGVTELKTSNGDKIYFKREARGWNYDRLNISTDGNYCHEPNKEYDYDLGIHSVRYLLENDTLYLLVNEQLQKYRPKQDNFPIRVELIDPRSPKGQEIEEKYRAKIKEEIPPINKWYWCFF